jgi:hypothetical protein
MSSNTEIDYGFFNFSAGETPDKVIAIALCRGDILPEDCLSYINTSRHDLLQHCPNQKEAIIWPDKCMLRYSNRSILGVMEDSPIYAWYNTGDVPDVEGFNGVLCTLLDRLIYKPHRIGKIYLQVYCGKRGAPKFQTINALVQCTPNLDRQQCNNCLDSIKAYIPQCCNGKQGGVFVAPSCYIRFEIYSFYEITNEASPPSSVLHCYRHHRCHRHPPHQYYRLHLHKVWYRI